MRTAAVVVLPTVTLLALLGCNPPLEENVAPFVEIITPRTVVLESTQTAIGYVDTPLQFALRIQDRDGDTSFNIQVFHVTEGVGDGRTEIANLVDVPADELFTFETSQGLPLGPQIVEVEVDDGKRDGIRVLTLTFDPIPGEQPTICWNDQVDCSTADPLVLPDTLDTLTGTLPFADDALEHYEYIWRYGDGTIISVNPGFTSTIGPDQTSRGDIVEFCVERWATSAGTAPSEIPDLLVCESIEIGNAPPGAPPTVDVEPRQPIPGTPVRCVFEEATDVDGDALSYTFEWTDGGGIVLGTDEWLPAEQIVPGAALFCSVSASDGELVGAAAASVSANVRTQSQSATGTVLGTTNDVLYGTAEESVFVVASDVMTGVDVQHVVALPQTNAGAGSVTFASSSSSNASYYARVVHTTGTAFGSFLSSRDVNASGELDLLVGSGGSAWFFNSQSIATGTLAEQQAGAVAQEISLTSGDVGFGLQGLLSDFTSAVTDDAAITLMDATTANRVFIVSGDNLGGSDLSLNPAVLPSVDATNLDDNFGVALAGGDFFGDAQHDLAVGNPTLGDDPLNLSGFAVYLFHSGSIVSGTAAIDSTAKIARDATRPDLGTTLAFADLDGNGKQDLLLGSPSTDEVAVFYAESLTGTKSFDDADVILTGGAGSGFGSHVFTLPSAVGGRDSLVVDAPLQLVGQGRVSVFDGSLFQLSTTVLSELDATYQLDGVSGAGSLSLPGAPGDMDGDGYADLCVVETSPTGSTKAFFVRSAF